MWTQINECVHQAISPNARWTFVIILPLKNDSNMDISKYVECFFWIYSPTYYQPTVLHWQCKDLLEVFFFFFLFYRDSARQQLCASWCSTFWNGWCQPRLGYQGWEGKAGGLSSQNLSDTTEEDRHAETRKDFAHYHGHFSKGWFWTQASIISQLLSSTFLWADLKVTSYKKHWFDYYYSINICRYTFYFVVYIECICIVLWQLYWRSHEQLHSTCTNKEEI